MIVSVCVCEPVYLFLCMYVCVCRGDSVCYVTLRALRSVSELQYDNWQIMMELMFSIRRLVGFVFVATRVCCLCGSHTTHTVRAPKVFSARVSELD